MIKMEIKEEFDYENNDEQQCKSGAQKNNQSLTLIKEMIAVKISNQMSLKYQRTINKYQEKLASKLMQFHEF